MRIVSLPRALVETIETAARQGAQAHGRGVVTCQVKYKMEAALVGFLPFSEAWATEPIPGIDAESYEWVASYDTAREYVLLFADDKEHGGPIEIHSMLMLYTSPAALAA